MSCPMSPFVFVSRHDLPSGLQVGLGGHLVEAVERALPVWPVPRLDQGQEPGQSGRIGSAGLIAPFKPDLGEIAIYLNVCSERP
jgi:hypothetical protein